MLSMKEILETFIVVLRQKNQVEYVVELKIDGLAISLTYENGILVTAAARRWEVGKMSLKM